MIKFNLYNVTNTETGDKARVSYSIGGRVDGRPAVTIYEKGFAGKLSDIFADAQNNSNGMEDYFETDRVVIFEDSEHYKAALATANRLIAKRGW